MISENILIGIDPDTEKSGVAIKHDVLELYNFNFFQLYDFLYNFKDKNIKVYIECGFLNGGNRHKVFGGSLYRTWTDDKVCEYLKIEFIQVRPTKAKCNSDYFKKITGYKKRTNQEQRDALMLIWGI